MTVVVAVRHSELCARRDLPQCLDPCPSSNVPQLVVALVRVLVTPFALCGTVDTVGLLVTQRAVDKTSDLFSEPSHVMSASVYEQGNARMKEDIFQTFTM